MQRTKFEIIRTSISINSHLISNGIFLTQIQSGKCKFSNVSPMISLSMNEFFFLKISIFIQIKTTVYNIVYKEILEHVPVIAHRNKTVCLCNYNA